MIKINNSTVRIISAVAIAIVLTASGLITFFNEESTFDNDSDTEYEIPADDRRDTVQSDTSFPDVSYPDTSVSSSDASKNATVSASDLPVNSDVQEEPDVPAEEKIKIKIVKIKTTANLRAGKSTNSEKIATLVKGTEWEFIKESGSRYQIKYSGKKTGWIPISCADLIEKEITIKHIGKYISGDPLNLKGTKEGDDVAQFLKNYGTMGGSVAVIQNGQVAYHYEYGYANSEKKVKVAENTKFRIASVTKVFTSMLAMSEVDDGKLDLDKSLTEIMGFKFYNPSYSKTPVTARMLLTHSSGIKDNDDMFNLKIQNVTHNSNYYCSMPGTGFAYTNLGMGLAGAVVEKVSDQTISQYAKDKFFEPMGIDASYDAKYLSDTKLVADCYSGKNIDCSNKYLCRSQEKGKPGQTFHLGQGGLLISAEDLASVFTILLNDGQYNGKQYLSENSVKEMFTVQPVNTKKNFEQCIGLRKSKNILKNREMYFHNGAAYGIFSLMAIDPSDKSGVIVITSGATTPRLKNNLFAVCDDILNYSYEYLIR